MPLPNHLARALALALAVAVSGQAAAPRQERLLQSEVRQQQIQRTTQRVGDQLSGIIEEFERNGIAGEDVKVLRAIRAVLHRLSEKEMAQVVTLLQHARQSGDDSAARKDVVAAYSGQKSITTQLKQLLLEYQRQQALYELSIMLRGLAARQSANLRVGVWLARQADQKPLEKYSEDEKRYLSQQEIDQLAIKDEAALLLGRLERMAREADGSATGERPRAAVDLARTGGLIPALEAAAADLKAGKLLSATGHEKKARDQMRDVARAMLMDRDLVDLLRAAIQETEAAMLLQEQVTTLTRRMERTEDAREAEDKQFEVVDNTDLVRRDINDVAPAAAAYFRTALDRMQEARALLTQGHDTPWKVTEVPLKQTDALASLGLARRALQDQLAKAELEAHKPENLLASLRELQQEVKALIQKEQQFQQTTAALDKKSLELKARAPEQGDILDRTHNAQQQAAEPAPEAAAALHEAARQMHQAQRELAQGKNPPEAQQSAIEALKKAEQALNEKLAQLEQNEKQLAALEQLLEKVEGVIKDEQSVRLETARHAVPSTPKAPPALAARQQTLAHQTGAIQKDAAQPAPGAAQHLGEAQARMNTARRQLDDHKARNAQAEQDVALNELYAAKRDIESKMDELRKELGVENDPSKNLADAAAALEKAQNDVDRAMNEMANAPAGLLENLQKQQQAIADALGEHARNEASPKAADAQKAAAQAAQQLARNNLGGAVTAMQQAQQGIEAAQPKTPPKTPGEAPSLAQLGQQQKDVKQLAEQLLAAQQGVSEQAMENAARHLGNALDEVTPIAAGDAGALPAAAQQAVQQAQAALTQAAAQAGAKQNQPAQAQAGQAAQALAQAQAALALAQAGLSSEMAQAPGQQPGQGQQPGEGQSPGQGQGKDGKQPGPGEGPPPPKGSGKDGNWSGTGGAQGQRRAVAGAGTYIGLPQRDRAAIQQSQAEKYPPEFGPLVEQYLKNLSDQEAE